MDTEQVRNHFKAQVSDYPELMRRLIPFYAEQHNFVLELIPFNQNDSFRVLDLGCGPGELAERLLMEYPRAEVTAFDLTEDMLELCQSRLGDDRCRYHLGDFRSDELGSGHDVVIGFLSLHHLEVSERQGFFRRACSSLNERGVLIAAEVILDESEDVRERQARMWREFMTRSGEDGEAWYARHQEKDHPMTLSALTHMLGAAGFVEAGCFWRYLNFALLSARRPSTES